MTGNRNFPHFRTESITLGNGLRVVAQEAPGAVSYIGCAIGAGSRDDGAHPGLAQFVEHTVFKGTRRRSSWQIANRMESIGGELNAYTTKEETMIYTNAPAGYAERAMEMISDLIANSTFPSAETDRERDVIIEEIHSYLDNPAEAVYDEFDDRLYADSELGHNILGTEESVRAISSENARSFVDRFYVPENMVVYCRAPEGIDKAFRIADKYFGGLSHPMPHRERLTPKVLPRFAETVEEESAQANTLMGCRLFGRRDPRRHALFLLNNHFGGPCMNSMLNRELRDRRGLVYTVDSSVALMSDTGALLIYFGTGLKEVGRCERIITRLIEKLAEKELSESALERIKRQYVGQLTVGTEQNENMAMNLAKSILYFGEVHSPEETIAAVNRVRPEDLRGVAELIAGQGLSRLTLG